MYDAVRDDSFASPASNMDLPAGARLEFFASNFFVFNQPGQSLIDSGLERRVGIELRARLCA